MPNILEKDDLMISYSIPAKERFKSQLHFDASSNLVLNLFWSYSYLISISVLILSRFHPGLGPDPVSVLSWYYLDPDAVLVLSSLRLKRELGPVSGPGCTLTISNPAHGNYRSTEFEIFSFEILKFRDFFFSRFCISRFFSFEIFFFEIIFSRFFLSRLFDITNYVFFVLISFR